MIDRREILDTAETFGLLPHVVEKDYVLGWVLAGIYGQRTLAKSWIFKGGTCLKKCYFETYRFSEDLDFTLTDPSQIGGVRQFCEAWRGSGCPSVNGVCTGDVITVSDRTSLLLRV